MDDWTDLEKELAAACHENSPETLPMGEAQQGWLDTVQDFLAKLPTLPAGPALLISGPDGIWRAPLEGTLLTLGRSSSCTVRLPYRFISRQHCRLHRDGEQWTIEDLGSTNGTLVNGEERKSGTLLAGDVIQVGEATILFLPSEKATVPEPPA